MSVNYFFYMLLLNMIMFLLFRYILLEIFPYLAEDNLLSNILSMLIAITLFIFIDYVIRLKMPSFYRKIINDRRILSRIENKEQKKAVIIAVISVVTMLIALSYFPDNRDYISLNITAEKIEEYSDLPLKVSLQQVVINSGLMLKWIIAVASLLIMSIALYEFVSSKTGPLNKIKTEHFIIPVIILSTVAVDLYSLKYIKNQDTGFYISYLLWLTVLASISLFVLFKRKALPVTVDLPGSNSREKYANAEEPEYTGIINVQPKEEKSPVYSVPSPKQNKEIEFNDFGKID